MANRPVPLTALILSVALTALVVGSALILALHADHFTLRPAEWSALRFTLLQAAISAVLSTALAIPVARALARRRFPGRSTLLVLFGTPFLLPVVVAVIGILSVYGRNGMVNQVLAALGLPPFPIFGLQGVVLAHVFFNLPLATRIILNGWLSIPSERFRLAKTLGLTPTATFRHLELPMLREVVPGAALLVFLFCLTSFVVALTLGGGPKATTLELAIYQALRFDFDLGRAALLAAIQFAICAIAVAAAAFTALPSSFGTGLDRIVDHAAQGVWRAGIDLAAIGLATIFLAAPMVSVALNGLPALLTLGPTVWLAALRSVLMALASSLLATTAALALAQAVAAQSRGARLIETAAMLPMAASSLVLGTGIFLAIRGIARPESVALPVTILVNAAMALPILYRMILPEARALHLGYNRLSATMGLPFAVRLRRVTIPRLARPLGLGAGIAAALAMGDLGVIALFAGDGNPTLPLLIQRLSGAYRMAEASAASLVLVACSLTLFWVFDWGGRRAAP